MQLYSALIILHTFIVAHINSLVRRASIGSSLYNAQFIQTDLYTSIRSTTTY
jgi:hypothetical protein